MAFSHSKRRERTPTEVTNEAPLARFVADTAHDSGGTARTHRNRILAALRRFEQVNGIMPSLAECFGDAELLAKVLGCDSAITREGQILRSTVNGTRNSFQAFAAALPVAGPLNRDEARRVLETARVLSTVQRGLRRRTIAGKAAAPDLRHVPTADEIGAVVECLRANGQPVATLTADVVALCYLTGLRIGAVLQLRRSDVVKMPDGRRWLTVTEKSRHDRRQVELRGERRGLFEEWETLPPDGKIWLRGGIALDYRRACRELASGCEAAGIPIFTFHRLRHAFATDVAVYLGLRGVMLAGGWLAEPVAPTYIGSRRRDA